MHYLVNNANNNSKSNYNNKHLLKIFHVLILVLSNFTYKSTFYSQLCDEVVIISIRILQMEKKITEVRELKLEITRLN